jgi:hypothetical protein
MQERKAENLQKIITRNPKNPDSQQGHDYWTETYETVESLTKEVIDNPDNASTYYLLGCWLMKHYNLKEASAKVLKRGLEVDPKHKFMKFLRLLPDYREEFIDSCEQVRKDRDQLYEVLSVVNGMTVYKPDANFIFCRLPDQAQSAPEITRRLFVEHNMYVKHCQGKTLPDSDRYLRIASRTQTENRNLAAALVDIIGQK